MKTITYLFLIVVFISACSTNEPVRYASSSPEIEISRSILNHYLEANWEAMKSHYADTAVVVNNVVKEKGTSIDVVIIDYKQDHELFASMSYVAQEDFFEMVLTDEGETWVNYWGLWKGTLKASGEVFEIPIHITQRFENQKIVLEHGYWNNSDIVIALSKLETSMP